MHFLILTRRGSGSTIMRNTVSIVVFSWLKVQYSMLNESRILVKLCVGRFAKPLKHGLFLIYHFQ